MTNLTAQLIAGAEWCVAVMLIGASFIVLALLLFDREEAAAPESDVDFERHVRGMGR